MLLRNLTKRSIISPTELIEVLQLIPEDQKISLADILEIDESQIIIIFNRSLKI